MKQMEIQAQTRVQKRLHNESKENKIEVRMTIHYTFCKMAGNGIGTLLAAWLTLCRTMKKEQKIENTSEAKKILSARYIYQAKFFFLPGLKVWRKFVVENWIHTNSFCELLIKLLKVQSRQTRDCHLS